MLVEVRALRVACEGADLALGRVGYDRDQVLTNMAVDWECVEARDENMDIFVDKLLLWNYLFNKRFSQIEFVF